MADTPDDRNLPATRLDGVQRVEETRVGDRGDDVRLDKTKEVLNQELKELAIGLGADAEEGSALSEIIDGSTQFGKDWLEEKGNKPRLEDAKRKAELEKLFREGKKTDAQIKKENAEAYIAQLKALLLEKAMYTFIDGDGNLVIADENALRLIEALKGY